MGGRIETPTNINGVKLKGYQCDLNHVYEGNMGSVKSLNSQVINQGWFKGGVGSVQDFETTYEMSDSNYASWNTLVFNKLIHNINFLNYLSVKCVISLEIKIVGITFSYDHKAEVHNLQNLISLDFLSPKNSTEEEDSEDGEEGAISSYFRKLKKTLRLEGFDISKFQILFQKALPQIIQIYQSKQLSQLEIPVPLGFLAQ